jgi:hypothetical protein
MTATAQLPGIRLSLTRTLRPGHVEREQQLQARHADLLDDADPCAGCPGGCAQCPAHTIGLGARTSPSASSRNKDAAAPTIVAAETQSVPPAPAHSGYGRKESPTNIPSAGGEIPTPTSPPPATNFAARDGASDTASAGPPMEPAPAEAAVCEMDPERWDGLS